MLIFDEDAAEEVKLIYRETVARVYTQHFKSIVNLIGKLQVVHGLIDLKFQFAPANKYDLIGVEESKGSSLFSHKKSIQNKSSVFSLGGRQQIVDELGETEVRLC